MLAKKYVNDNIKCKNIVRILRNDEIRLDRKKGLIKSRLFKLINQSLYSKSPDLLFSDHLVIAKDDMHTMEFHVKNVHDRCH